MSSRDKILTEIRKNKPASLPLPEKFSVAAAAENLVDAFKAVLQSIGGRVTKTTGFGEVETLLRQTLATGVEVVNGIGELPNCNSENYRDKTAAEIEGVHTFFARGEIAVAENGAIWLPEKAMGHRLLPFICQELVLVIDEANLVANMHEAYDKIRVDGDGFGVFIAGPSKTADIEQSLVIGAHGPLALHVFIKTDATSG